MEGRGECRYADGTRYVGMWRRGMKEGRGTLIFPNGAVYEGHFRDDVMDSGGHTGTFTLSQPVTITHGEDEWMIPSECMLVTHA